MVHWLGWQVQLKICLKLKYVNFLQLQLGILLIFISSGVTGANDDSSSSHAIISISLRKDNGQCEGKII